MNRYILLPSLLLILATGCDKGGVTDVDIQVYNGFLMPAMAIEVAPDVPVKKNKFRSWDGGFRGKQHLEIAGHPTATLILVPSGHSFGLSKPDSIVYIGQRPGAATAIEISTGRWQYRRIDLEEESAGVEDSTLLKQLESASWQQIGHYRFVAIRSLLWAWVTSSPGAQRASYRRSAGNNADRLIISPSLDQTIATKIYGTIGDANSPEPPAEWNALINTLREFCPPREASTQPSPQPSERRTASQESCLTDCDSHRPVGRERGKCIDRIAHIQQHRVNVD